MDSCLLKVGSSSQVCSRDSGFRVWWWRCVFVCVMKSVLSVTDSFVLGSAGTKVADPCCYGHTQFHLLPDRLKRERFIKERLEDQIEVVYRSNGIASLFAWTAAQAMYQGEMVSWTNLSWLWMPTVKFFWSFLPNTFFLHFFFLKTVF